MNPLNKVYTFQEASELWGLGESTLRSRAYRNEFLPGEARKSGKTWLITDDAMRRIYGSQKYELIGGNVVLTKSRIENIIQDLDAQDIYRSTLEKALKHESTGIAYTYIDIRTGEVSTTWEPQGEHEDGTFYIVLCSIDTPIDVEGIDDIEAQVDYWVEDAQLRPNIKYQINNTYEEIEK